MSLREYKRKRDFSKTPEPAGAGVKSAPGRQFVVQKHAASRLHYDFRLELDGTLKSWAVPKGPSLDPSAKSLAVQVEDHPLNYATFEGVIPLGEYGGGTVMVWDHGTWEPEVDPSKGLKEGKLKFTLNGEKLHGSWALVRMGGKAGDDGKNWLLIKHKDDEAKAATKYDVVKREPRSVVSGREMDEIAMDADRVWSSNRNGSKKSNGETTSKSRSNQAHSTKASTNGNLKKQSRFTARDLAKVPAARKAKLRSRFKPQLATLVSRIPEGENWLHELKFDGYRAIAIVKDGKVRLLSRNDNDWTAKFRPVADAVAQLPIKNAILDGEVVSLDKKGVSNFQQLQNVLRRGDAASLVYYLFDVPYLEGYDLTETPLVDRKEVLARLLLSTNPANDGTLRYSDHIVGHGENVLQQACRSAMEGVIAKRADSTYQQSRSPSWLKIKCLKQQEFVIGGFSKAEGTRVGFGALLLGYYKDGELQYAGRVGTGFNTQSLKQLSRELKARKIDSSPFNTPMTGAERRGVTWVKPELVAEIEFAEWTDDGRLRHPSFQGLREDKPAGEVMREQPKSMAAVEKASRKTRSPGASAKTSAADFDKLSPGKGATPSMSREAVTPRGKSGKSSEAIEVAGARLTNPARVLYPADGFTKRDVAEYYEKISDWILPYVAGRPLTLVRCPEGHTGECFYQKHLTGSMPDAVEGVMVKEKGKTDEYVMIRDVAGLVSLVQMGVLEMHPWPARRDNLERPDYLVFDLDPGEGVTWKDVVQGARDVRKRLEDVGLTTFLRTSGGKGLHVCVPIARRNDWDDVKQFAKSVADTMEREQPDRYIATMSKAKRRGKVYVDYLRNQRGATAIASYSTRARPGATVATPISWNELGKLKAANTFDIKSLSTRLGKLKRDPWADFFATKQSLTREIRAAFE
jgi:bifunctional non-homologous end joining protein LigD